MSSALVGGFFTTVPPGKPIEFKNRAAQRCMELPEELLNVNQIQMVWVRNWHPALRGVLVLVVTEQTWTGKTVGD